MEMHTTGLRRLGVVGGVKGMVAACAVTAMLVGGVGQARADLFLDIPSIPGSSPTADFANQIEALEFGIRVEQVDDGSGTLVPAITPLRVVAPAGSHSPPLSGAAFTGETLSDLVLTITQPGDGGRLITATWEFSEFTVTRFSSVSGPTTPDGFTPIFDTYDFLPSEIVTYTFFDNDEKGALLGTTEQTLNLLDGTASLIEGGSSALSLASGGLDISDLVAVPINAAVPEPASGLALLGLSGAVLLRRGRQA